MATDDEWEVLVTPILCLGLYYESTLVGVFPHADGDVMYDAADAIAALRTGEVPPPLDLDLTGTTVSYDESTDGETEPTTACPRCDGQVVNVHGILACTGCRWTAVRRPTPLRPA